MLKAFRLLFTIFIFNFSYGQYTRPAGEVGCYKTFSKSPLVIKWSCDYCATYQLRKNNFCETSDDIRAKALRRADEAVSDAQRAKDFNDSGTKYDAFGNSSQQSTAAKAQAEKNTKEVVEEKTTPLNPQWDISDQSEEQLNKMISEANAGINTAVQRCSKCVFSDESVKKLQTKLTDCFTEEGRPKNPGNPEDPFKNKHLDCTSKAALSAQRSCEYDENNNSLKLGLIEGFKYQFCADISRYKSWIFNVEITKRSKEFSVPIDKKNNEKQTPAAKSSPYEDDTAEVEQKPKASTSVYEDDPGSDASP
jgi:hypothetical protein